MDYLDIELRITSHSETEYLASILRSPAGEASAVIPKLLAERDFVNDIRRVATAVRGVAAAPDDRESSRAISWGGDSEEQGDSELSERDPAESIRAFGERLFRWLFAGEMQSRYRTSLAAARNEGCGLRLRMRLNSPELAALPWEFLYDDVEQEYVSLTRETPIVRYVEMGRGQQSIKLHPPLKILGMVASPGDLPQLNVQREREQMEDAISHPVEQGLIELTWLEGGSWRDLQEAMRSGQWHVFHFIGHGGFDAKSQEGFIALTDKVGKLYKMTATQLGRMLSGHRSMRLAVLNCCEGARASETDLFSSTGAVLTRKDIPAVVSMQYEITDEAAIEFSRMLYYSIAQGDPVDGAIQEARLAISMSSPDSAEWATPVLHMRTADGGLFEIDVKGAIFRDSQSSSSKSGSTRSATSGDAPIASAAAPVVNRPREHELTILLNRMRQFWIDGVLEKTSSDSRLIDLDMEIIRDGHSQPFDADEEEFELIDFFTGQGGSILLHGDPGAGKSTKMLTLARDLIERAESNPNQAVPVIVSLSSWHGEKFFDWMVEQIRVRYLIPRDLVEAWLKGNRLLLMLDGLDEVQETCRAACVATINEFAPEAGLAGMVVCCRTREYIELPLRLRLTAAVTVKGLSRQTIHKQLDKWGPSFAALQKLIKNDTGMQLLASSPLMLNLMAEVYEGAEELDTIESKNSQQM